MSSDRAIPRVQENRPPSRTGEHRKNCFGFARLDCLFCLLVAFSWLVGIAYAEAAEKEFISCVAEVEGVKIHYTTAARIVVVADVGWTSEAAGRRLPRSERGFDCLE
jgi:hypothetical protein